MLIAAARLGHDLLALDQGEAWAHERLVGAMATAVLLDGQGIVAAWERAASGPILVARGPRRMS